MAMSAAGVSFPLVARRYRPEDTVVDLDGVTVGGESFTVMAGPCSVESDAQMEAAAALVAGAGCAVLRGGAFKPRTSPYAFRGLGEEGLALLRRAADRWDLRVVTEAMDPGHVDLVARYADVIQVGARNMQNFALLSRVGRAARPVLLKRGISATLEELLGAAEYVASAGNPRVILCERGIRAFGDHARFTLDIAAVPALKALTHLPVVVDPSHSAGRRDLVAPLARAGAAAGADGLIVEVHPDPGQALCDGGQSLYPHQLTGLVADLRALAPAVGRSLTAGRWEEVDRVQAP